MQDNLLSKLFMSRSREGAWIEISSEDAYKKDSMVAPARERGLKYRRTMQ